MKKVMIALAAIALGFAAQAATVDWSVKGSNTTDGYTVLLFVGDKPASQYDTYGALVKAAISSSTIARKGRDYFASGAAQGETVTSEAKYYYAIVASDEATSFQYVEATGMGAYAYDPPTTGSIYDKIDASEILASGISGKIGKDPEPTPEPTSAMLMLLGVAGLALRRKQK